VVTYTLSRANHQASKQTNKQTNKQINNKGKKQHTDLIQLFFCGYPASYSCDNA
jgi:hypothetical protein